MKEREKENYDTIQEFIREVVIPEMQIKLRQGFGQAIRTETDTCVIAILDERAAPEGRYFSDVVEALPEMKITRDLREVKRFVRNVKNKSYFKESSP